VALALLLVTGSVTIAEAAHRTRSSSRYSSAASREISSLSKQDPLEAFPVPILFDVPPRDVRDTWGDARSNGRTHEGTDIFAPKGAYVVAPSDSVVSEIGFGANGGNFVYTINPGGERFYFAHLDDYKDGLKQGDILKKGDLIGYVGNTGNASGGATHLHFGIYASGAQNPFSRLTDEFSVSERVDAAARIIDDADDEEAEARVMVGNHVAFFREAVASGEELPEEVVSALAATVVKAAPVTSTAGVRDLTVGSRGQDVVALQQRLILEGKGPAARALADATATGYFGPVTRDALAEYQAAVGIAPAVGYYGPLTRARII